MHISITPLPLFFKIVITATVDRCVNYINVFTLQNVGTINIKFISIYLRAAYVLNNQAE